MRHLIRALGGLLYPNDQRHSYATEAVIRWVADRKGHDRRYAIDPSRGERELDWSADVPFDEGLASATRWYLDNPGWVERVRTGEYMKWTRRDYGDQRP